MAVFLDIWEHIHLARAITVMMLMLTAASLFLKSFPFCIPSLLIDHISALKVKTRLAMYSKWSILSWKFKCFLKLYIWFIISQLNNICVQQEKHLICGYCFYLKNFQLTLFLSQLSKQSAPQEQRSIFHPLPYICSSSSSSLLTFTHSLPHSSPNCISHSPHSPLHKSWDSSALMDN